ncbi:MAG TPA: chromate transporter, partial [Rikenellaceae bacterium]|nr:chromate transporter [Rikenellaceae bacterium]
GGGYAMLSLIQDEVVYHNGWITMEVFSDIVAVSQMTPGPIAINTATYVGYTASGGNLLGSVMATLALIIPSVVMMSIVIRAYKKYSKNQTFQGIFS